MKKSNSVTRNTTKKYYPPVAICTNYSTNNLSKCIYSVRVDNRTYQSLRWSVSSNHDWYFVNNWRMTGYEIKRYFLSSDVQTIDFIKKKIKIHGKE